MKWNWSDSRVCEVGGAKIEIRNPDLYCVLESENFN